MAKICPRCNQLSEDNRNFCVHCGTPLASRTTDTPLPGKSHFVISRTALYAVAIVVLVCIGAGLFYLQGSVRVDSDPQGAGVYVDSVYKGSTPSEIRLVAPGKHHIEFRHGDYPDWEQDFEYAVGQTTTITADLSDNIVPKVTAICSGPAKKSIGPNLSACNYGQGDTISISGTAVRPHPKQNAKISLSLYNLTTARVVQQKTVDISADNTFSGTFESSALASGNYVVSCAVGDLPGYTSVSLTVESPEDTNTRVLRQIVEDYHKIHTYNLNDMYVCSDMAQDVWNIVDTKGIHALLVAGKIDTPNADWKSYDHAWVIAEVSPKKWVALETTGGFLVTDAENPYYFRGLFFETPGDLKTNMDLRRDYNNEVTRFKSLESQYNAKLSEYQSALSSYNAHVSTYNQNYAGKALTASQYQDAQTMKSTISTEQARVATLKGELDQIYATYTSENQIMENIVAQMTAQAAKGNQLFNG